MSVFVLLFFSPPFREELTDRIAKRLAAEDHKRHAGRVVVPATGRAKDAETQADQAVAEPKKRIREPEAPTVGRYLQSARVQAASTAAAPRESESAEELSVPVIPKKKAVRTTFGNFDAW